MFRFRQYSFQSWAARSKLSLVTGAVAGLMAVPCAAASARTPTSISVASALKIQGNVYLVAGAGGNVTVQAGAQGVLVVDAGVARASQPLLAEIRKLANDRTIRYVINTHGHPDHIGGNQQLREAGATILGGNVTMDDPRGQQGATVIAHENVVLRASTQNAGDRELEPTETFSSDAYDLFFNDEAVQLIHPPAAHTDGDVMVFFRKSDVLVTGDVFNTTSYPVIDIASGGSINGVIAALNVIIGIAVPRDKQEGGTIVVPGHGRLCDEADVVEYRDMVTIIRDRIQHMRDEGMSLDQVKAAKPTQDYDGRFGTGAGDWSTEKFVEAVYSQLDVRGK